MTAVASGEWRRAKLGYLVREMGGSTPSKERQDFWGGDVPWVSPKDMKVDVISNSIDHITEAGLAHTSLRPVPAGSVLLVVRGMILAHSVPVALTEAPVTLNQDMKALVPGPRVSGLFLRYCLQAHRDLLLALVEEAGHGTRCLRSEQWRKFEVSLPPLPTQKAIADFLDRKTAAIDALIEKKQKLLDLLAEKRAALINQAVTKGLDPNVPMRDSGIPWIGEIPAHWALTAVKRACSSVRDGTHGPPPRLPAGEHRLLSARNIQNGRFILRDDDRRMSPEAFAELERSYTVREGDVVLASVGATTGKSAVVGPVDKVSVQRSLAILRPNHDRISSDYLHTWLDASVTQHAIQLKASQYAAQGGIYLEDVANLPLVLPSKPEQAQILEATAPRLGRMWRMAENLSDSCIRLQEYRHALITAAVTGQLDIGEEAAT